MAKYALRFSFDFGSGVCFWSLNEAARERFGYPICQDDLPLTHTIRVRVGFIVAWYDTFLDWDNAPEMSCWWPREKAMFNAAAQELLSLVRGHLGGDFEIVDKSGTGIDV